MKDQNEDMGFQVIVNSPGNYIAKEMNFDIKGDFNASTNPMKNYIYTDEQISEALKKCVGEDKVINAKWKWAGAYWYLIWAHNFPVDAKEFCDRILKLPGASEFEIPCEYENIRKYTTLSFMYQNPCKLENVKPQKMDESVFLKCRVIKEKLEETLKKELSSFS